MRCPLARSRSGDHDLSVLTDLMIRAGRASTIAPRGPGHKGTPRRSVTTSGVDEPSTWPDHRDHPHLDQSVAAAACAAVRALNRDGCSGLIMCAGGRDSIRDEGTDMAGCCVAPIAPATPSPPMRTRSAQVSGSRRWSAGGSSGRGRSSADCVRCGEDHNFASVAGQS